MATASVRFRKWVGSEADRLLGKRDLTKRGLSTVPRVLRFGLVTKPPWVPRLRGKSTVRGATLSKVEERLKVGVAERTQGNV